MAYLPSPSLRHKFSHHMVQFYTRSVDGARGPCTPPYCPANYVRPDDLYSWPTGEYEGQVVLYRIDQLEVASSGQVVAPDVEEQDLWRPPIPTHHH
ncbi:hypothetical protein FKM82_027985 [Ascaphus truei]